MNVCSSQGYWISEKWSNSSCKSYSIKGREKRPLQRTCRLEIEKRSNISFGSQVSGLGQGWMTEGTFRELIVWVRCRD